MEKENVKVVGIHRLGVYIGDGTNPPTFVPFSKEVYHNPTPVIIIGEISGGCMTRVLCNDPKADFTLWDWDNLSDPEGGGGFTVEELEQQLEADIKQYSMEEIW